MNHHAIKHTHLVSWWFSELGLPLVIIQFHGIFHSKNHPAPAIGASDDRRLRRRGLDRETQFPPAGTPEKRQNEQFEVEKPWFRVWKMIEWD